MKTTESWLQRMFEDRYGFTSSKRGIGALCFLFAMVMFVIVFFMSEPRDISGNILTFLLTIVASGTALLGITMLERKQ